MNHRIYRIERNNTVEIENLINSIQDFSPILCKDFDFSAVDKFGSDPVVFKDKFSNFNNLIFNAIREGLEKYPWYYYFKPDHFSVVCSELLQSWFNAIMQINMEIPGFKDEFPEIKEYLKQINTTYYVKSLVTKKIENYYNGYNRFSGKFDMKTIKNLLKIRKNNMLKKERVDNYIARCFPELLKDTKSPRLREYLIKNFSQQDALLPEDYHDICIMIEDKDKNFKELREFFNKFESSSTFWIDYYFNNQEKILENIDYSSLPVKVARGINLTRI